jgi:lipoprotein-releasing system permease protein
MALITVLSVFNGFELVIKSLYHTFNPDLLVSPERGKTFDTAEFPFDGIKNIKGVKAVVSVIEEDALFKYGNKQFIARIKGVSDNYAGMRLLDSVIVDGSFVLKEGNSDFAVFGAGVAWILGINLDDISKLVSVYVPKRGNSSSFNIANAFNTMVIRPAGVFSIQQDFDEKYVLTSLRFVSKLLDYKNEITAVEIYLDKKACVDQVQKEVQALLPDGKFSVKNRFQQNSTLFKVMKSEKTAIFLILVFILILASFNMIGSVSILIVEKTKDIAVLKSMGAAKKKVKRIFILEGMLITLTGAAGGLLLGALILFLQQKFSLITLGGGDGAFIINAYPVKMEWTDFAAVFVTVQVIGIFASWYPVKYLLRNFDEIGIKW